MAARYSRFGAAPIMSTAYLRRLTQACVPVAAARRA